MSFLQFTKILPNPSEQVKLEEYLALRKELAQVEKYIENKDNVKKKKKLVNFKKSLLKRINEVEEQFYNINRGLRIGVAVDLDTKYGEHILLYIPWSILHKHFVVYGTTGYGKAGFLL